MTAIAISRLHYPVTTLGPGRRIGIWLQGCSIRCAGCISADTWAVGRRTTSVNEVIDGVRGWLGEADGVTISGGEPFDQAGSLMELLTGLRTGFVGDIFVYSGYPIERLEAQLQAAVGLIDALITDPFIAGMKQSLPLRGSDNQRLHLLTALGHARFSEYTIPSNNQPSFDVMFDEDGTVWFAGVPSQEAFRHISRSLEANGHEVLTSQDRRVGNGGGAP